MLKKIKVVPLAEESFGVRSMCTFIETSDVKILLDAGASLAPNRFRYPPHPREYQAIAECRERIEDIRTLHYDEKGIAKKKGVLRIETVSKKMEPIEGKISDIKAIWQELQKYIKRDE